MRLLDGILDKLRMPRRVRDPAHAAWRKEHGETRRYEFPSLGSDGVALDLGGFEGQWAERIHAKYGCTVHVFEPHPGYAERLRQKFAGNPRVHVHPVALASEDGVFRLGVLGDATSAFREATEYVDCRSVEAAAYLAGAGIGSADVVKVNIEGGEYDILPHLIRTGFIGKVGTLQVQFHRLGDDDVLRRDEIRAALSATHRETWCYPFVWEEWVRG